MADNGSPNTGVGVLGLLVGALAGLLVVAFLYAGGDRFFGNKRVESDRDLPPVHTSQPRQ